MSYQIVRPQIRFDVKLLTELNEEYAARRLVPKPYSAERSAFVERGKANAERIAKMFAVQGKRILEIGCGEGDVAEYLAKNYDCEVHGIDLQPNDIWKEHQYAQLHTLDLSSLALPEDGTEDALGTFDFIYSYSAWEHVLHPFGLLRATRPRLRQSGKFYLSTNLFRGPIASHLYRDLYFPWPHLLFSDDVIYDYYVSRGLPPRFPSWVNRLSIADYLNYFGLSGFDLEKITYTIAPIDEDLYSRFEYWLARYPRFDLERDHLHAILTPSLKEASALSTVATSLPPRQNAPEASSPIAGSSVRIESLAPGQRPTNATSSQSTMAKPISLSVDVEAQPVRATGDPIQQLIFGRFGAEEFGISRMMDIADAAGHKLILYLDLCEYWMYGDALLDVAREIARRGHDLQLHAHADLLPRAFWTDRGMMVPPALDRFPDVAADALISALCELAVRSTGLQPRAFRGGAFRFNPAVLGALARNGIQVSSNYYAAAKYWPARKPHARPFHWESGVLELPISTAEVDGAFRYAVFENLAVESQDKLAAFLAAVRAVGGSLDIPNFVLHSWSLLKKDEAGKFSASSDHNVERFQAFLSNLSALGYRGATTDEIVDAADALRAGPGVNYATVFESTPGAAGPAPAAAPPVQTATAESIVAVASAPRVSEPDRTCLACGSAHANFTEFFGRAAVRCPCGSLERHRAFLQLCKSGSTSRWSPSGKDLLLISPNPSEERSLRGLAASVRTLEVRADIRADFHLDICDAPALADASFDAVVAHHIFAHVYDDRKAFAEIARILRREGRLFLTTPLTASGQTQEITDVDEISRLWGRELYDRYRVGTFRRYGEQDLLRVLAPWFSVVVHHAVDSATGEVVPIVECTRRDQTLRAPT